MWLRFCYTFVLRPLVFVKRSSERLWWRLLGKTTKKFCSLSQLFDGKSCVIVRDGMANGSQVSLSSERDFHMRTSAKKVLGLFLMLLWVAVAQGCQCGVSLRADPEIGPRQLKTDLPENALRFDQVQRLSQTKPFVLYNDGTQPLNVISFGIIDDPEGIYAILESPSSQKPFTLAPGIQHAVSFSVRFRARRPGIRRDRTLAVSFWSLRWCLYARKSLPHCTGTRCCWRRSLLSSSCLPD